MKLAIMQPYFFPYIGYFQLIHAVDTFVIYDDVNYIKGGWINRNNILINGHSSKITLSISNASSFRKINEISVANDKKNKENTIDSIYYAYKKAPHFSVVMPIVESALKNHETNLSKKLSISIQKICDYLHIKTHIINSSDLEKNNSLKGAEKVIQICQILHANIYINSFGGRELYSKQQFKEKGISLNFIKTGEIRYTQFMSSFVPNLSIIDVLMFNSIDEINLMLENFSFL